MQKVMFGDLELSTTIKIGPSTLNFPLDAGCIRSHHKFLAQ